MKLLYPRPCTLYPKKAFSLIELVIAMAIFATISLMIGGAYLAHLNLFNKQNVQIDVSSQNKLALDEMVNQIREAKNLRTTCPTSWSCNPAETASSKKIIFEVWPLDSSGQPCDPSSCTGGAANKDIIIYQCETTCPTTSGTTNLIKKVRPWTTIPASSRQSSTDIVAPNIKDLQFTYYNAANNPVSPGPFFPLAIRVEISLTTESKFFGSTQQTQTITQSAKAVLRNYNY